jgi:wobble nucleotide-excising tRNase
MEGLLIVRIRLLRNIGTFDSVASGAAIALSRLSVIYAENGRGKTTLAAVLRSLATGDPMPISERRRLAAQHPPHIVVECDDAPHAIFENGAWTRTLPQMVVFDDVFVDENVYSGLAVDSSHRQRLHELVIGAAGVTLNRQLQDLVQRVEAHNANLRNLSAAIPATTRGPYTVDAFCDLAPRPNIEEAIIESERRLAAARHQDAIRAAQEFTRIGLPTFDANALSDLLGQDLPALDAAALTRLQAHFQTLGAGGERWVADGVGRATPNVAGSVNACPFCGQDLAGSTLIEAYRGYFSAEYAALDQRISAMISDVQRAHGAAVLAAFERSVRTAGERQRFWSSFTEVPPVELNTADISRDWQAAKDEVEAVLRAKRASPLSRMAIPDLLRRGCAHSKCIGRLSTM